MVAGSQSALADTVIVGDQSPPPIDAQNTLDTLSEAASSIAQAVGALGRRYTVIIVVEHRDNENSQQMPNKNNQ